MFVFYQMGILQLTTFLKITHTHTQNHNIDVNDKELRTVLYVLCSPHRNLQQNTQHQESATV